MLGGSDPNATMSFRSRVRHKFSWQFDLKPSFNSFNYTAELGWHDQCKQHNNMVALDFFFKL